LEIFSTLRVAGVEYEVRMTSVENQPVGNQPVENQPVENRPRGFQSSESQTSLFNPNSILYLMRAPKRVTMPVLSTEIGNSKPILNREQSSSIFDGFVTIHWTYPFDNFPDPVNGIKPIIKNHFINWGFVDQGRVLK